MNFSEPDWTTRAGRKLQQLADLLAEDKPDRHFEVVVFGSAPISLYVDASHVSADVDLYVSQLGGGQPDEAQVVKDCITRHGLGKGQSAFYIELTPSWVFKAGSDWQPRAQKHQVRNVTFVFPAPLDILIGKLHRLEKKDLSAFELIRPTERDLIARIRDVPGFFRLNLGGEKSAFHANTERLWPLLYGHPINVKKEIIAPALAALEDYEGDDKLDLQRVMNLVEF